MVSVIAVDMFEIWFKIISEQIQFFLNLFKSDSAIDL